MISKARIKWIKSLELRKYRVEHKLFVAEGPKLVGELLATRVPTYLCALKEWMQNNKDLLQKIEDYDEVTQEELNKASLLRTPQSVLAVFKIEEQPFDITLLENELCLALDNVQDPGNIGTIMRIADWFGIQNIICAEGTVDIYNPKSVQATMGALARVKVHYTNLEKILAQYHGPIYGTFLDGKNIYKEEISSNGIIVMGNEGNGISENIKKLVTKRLYIPNYPQGSTTTESLNVAVATSIVCAEFRRRQQQ